MPFGFSTTVPSARVISQGPNTLTGPFSNTFTLLFSGIVISGVDGSIVEFCKAEFFIERAPEGQALTVAISAVSSAASGWIQGLSLGLNTSGKV